MSVAAALASSEALNEASTAGGDSLQTLDPQDQTLNPQDQTLNPQDQTLNPQEQTLNPQEGTEGAASDRQIAEAAIIRLRQVDRDFLFGKGQVCKP